MGWMELMTSEDAPSKEVWKYFDSADKYVLVFNFFYLWIS